MVPITIVNGVYKPTNITGGPHIVGGTKWITMRRKLIFYMLDLPRDAPRAEHMKHISGISGISYVLY